MERHTKKEENPGYKGGKSGAKVKIIKGPAVGKTSGNKTSGGKSRLK
jgi:hypothetical protein